MCQQKSEMKKKKKKKPLSAIFCSNEKLKTKIKKK
jgi:hypothetical protein